MFSLLNRSPHRRRSDAPDARGTNAIGSYPVAAVYVLSLVAMIVSRVTS
jgi:hypothetical protein